MHGSTHTVSPQRLASTVKYTSCVTTSPLPTILDPVQGPGYREQWIRHSCSTSDIYSGRSFPSVAMTDRQHLGSSSTDEHSRDPSATSTEEPIADPLDLDAGFDAEHSQGDDNGPAHEHGAGESNDHLASIYESQDEQFATIAQFIREGLQSGEQCLYIAEANTTDEVLAVLREGGIDVETALESGALALHTAGGTELKTGTFVPAFEQQPQLEFWEDSLAAATTEEFAGLRVAVEMTWALGDETSLDRLVEYEAQLNTIFAGDDYTVLCQYDREQFPAGVLSDVIQTHPLLVYDGEVCRNFYYGPPAEFDADDPSLAVDRQVETLADRTKATNALAHREQGLHTLTTATQELMHADEQEINTQGAAIAQEVLDVAYTGLWRYDEEAGDLQLQTSSPAPQIDSDSIRYPEQFTERAWETFVTKETGVDNEVPPPSDSTAAEHPMRSRVIVPLGRHGILCAGCLRPGMIDDSTIDLAETIGATIEATLDRAEREQHIAQQNEELTRLTQINSVIREIDQALVEADTREDIDRVVCEQLAGSDLYECAWIGEADPGTDTIVPREWAGVDPGYLDRLTITTDDTSTGQGPIGTALRTRELQVVQDIITAPRFTPWREHTLEQGVRSCVSIPLVYNDSLYGVLAVYTEQPLSDERTQTVLGELGETIAHTISSAQTKQALQTDSVVELSLQVREPETVLSSLAQQVSCQIEFEGLVNHSAETAQVFVTTRGAAADEICATATESLAIETVTTLSEGEDGCRFKLVMADPPLAAAFIDQDVEIRQLTFDADGATAVVGLPTTRDVRPVIETIQTTFPETELVNRRTSHRSSEPLPTCRAIYEDSLTDRQQDTLRTAYLSGFFESPRETTGQEIAASLEVSQPTFTQHLRAGQRKLFKMVFDGSE
jgi:GAF domain-containing protein